MASSCLYLGGVLNALLHPTRRPIHIGLHCNHNLQPPPPGSTHPPPPEAGNVLCRSRMTMASVRWPPGGSASTRSRSAWTSSASTGICGVGCEGVEV